MPDEPLIVQVLKRYFPEWEPPPDKGREWVKCHCPSHGDGNASAGVSYRLNGFRCLGCGFGGSAVGIIQQQEEVTYQQAVRLATSISPGSNAAVQRKPARKPRRRVYGEPGTGGPEDPRVVPPGVRGRSAPWA